MVAPSPPTPTVPESASCRHHGGVWRRIGVQELQPRIFRASSKIKNAAGEEVKQEFLHGVEAVAKSTNLENFVASELYIFLED